jgi:uncharacterized NAD(P)/FAD-binding protein YdhS
MVRRHAIIIGGGASGVLFAYHLLRLGRAAFRVTLIEQRPEIGRGLAYHTGNPDHLLNVRAANMSARPEEPDHFWRWLSAHDANRCADRYCFVPRRVYGDYVASLIRPLVSRGDEADGLRILNSECVSVSENAARGRTGEWRAARRRRRHFGDRSRFPKNPSGLLCRSMGAAIRRGNYQR